MPNHCWNTVTFSKRRKEIVQFLYGGPTQAVDFNKILPMPKELTAKYPHSPEETDACGIPLTIGKLNKKKFGASNWYEWCLKNWGTKWNAYDINTDKDSDYLQFTTAWSPPEPAMRLLSKLFPDVAITLEFEECGMLGTGEITFKNGKITHEQMFPLCPECGSKESACECKPLLQ